MSGVGGGKMRLIGWNVVPQTDRQNGPMSIRILYASQLAALVMTRLVSAGGSCHFASPLLKIMSKASRYILPACYSGVLMFTSLS